MEEKIMDFICTLKGDPSIREKFGSQSDIVQDIGLDSLQLINFILKVEDEFDIEIDFEDFDLSHLSSIDAFCSFISERKQ
ncbi:acyl carrier protein [Acetivibrio cellulolyticus]|uniref:acyl carrier protein n=1 Tax=Acetivibrio cellulolyticus TaxID=35830 RepID=UPI0001E2E715|nr:acyl carrier protein [Acetivibrio cellulolyticus]